MTPTIINANCLDALRDMPDNSVDAVITDPPYGLSNTAPDKVVHTIVQWASGDREHVPAGRGFMSQEWDAFVPPPAVWDECYRVLKPGGHMAVFAGTRTQDLMGLSVRLAGFEIRDSLAWLYGSGFPKSQDVGKAIDKAAGVERAILGVAGRSGGGRTAMNDAPGHGRQRDYLQGEYHATAPATDEARQWSGWGTALKPAHEPILLARKPLVGTVAANVTEWGTGAINIDATRIGIDPAEREVIDNRSGSNTKAEGWGFQPTGQTFKSNPAGRFPANVVLDEHAAHELDQQSGNVGANGDNGQKAKSKFRGVYGDNFQSAPEPPLARDKGGASRFFYVAKAPKRERPNVDGVQHPTVKPLALMRWLVRLLTPPGGVVLDPFAGSGTTVEAAILEGFNPIGIEAHEPYIRLIEERVARNTPQGGLLDELEESA